MTVNIFEGERVDYTPGHTLKVIQSPDVFSFSIDAVLLARFVYLPIQKGKILDLCTGNGIIPLLLTERSKANIVGVEIQERLYHMAERNRELNSLSEQLSFYKADLNKLPTELRKHSFDVVTCNPPYFPHASDELINENEHLAIARHEIHCTLEDVVRVSSMMVRNRGKVALVHRPERLPEMMSLMKSYGIEPKRLQFIHPKAGGNANIVLLEGIKGGKAGLTVLPALTVYDQANHYTTSFQEVYEGR